MDVGVDGGGDTGGWAGGPEAGSRGPDVPVVVAAGPEDLIASVWFGLGYKPRDSLVAVGLDGPRRRIGLILRTDLPAEKEPVAHLVDVVADALETVRRSGAAAAVAIVVRERVLRRPAPAIVDLLDRTARHLDLPLADVLGVTRTAFGSFFCPDPKCCPPQGRPIGAVLAGRAAAAYRERGATVAEEEQDLLADLLGPSSSEPTSSTSSTSSGPSGSPGAGSGRRSAGPLSRPERESWWQVWIRACATGAGPGMPGLSGAMHDPGLRDAVLTHVLGAPADQARRHLHGASGWARDDGAGPDLAGLLSRGPGSEPVEPGSSVLAAAVRAARPGERAPALAVLAMLAWYEGRGGRARLLVEKAAADSEVSLTRLVAQLIMRRVPPPWQQEWGEA